MAGHDLAEGGFDDGVAAAVGGPVGFGPRFAGHAFPQRGVRRDASAETAITPEQ